MNISIKSSKTLLRRSVENPWGKPKFRLLFNPLYSNTKNFTEYNQKMPLSQQKIQCPNLIDQQGKTVPTPLPQKFQNPKGVGRARGIVMHLFFASKQASAI
jgi:hypothetical protein